MYKIMCKNIVRVRQDTDDNMAHAHSILDTYGYKHTLIIFNTYCFFAAKIIIRTRLTVTLYVHCLSCYLSTLWNLSACDCQNKDIFKVLCYGDDGYEYENVYCDKYSPISRKKSTAAVFEPFSRRWEQHSSPKHCRISTKPHGVTSWITLILKKYPVIIFSVIFGEG